MPTLLNVLSLYLVAAALCSGAWCAAAEPGDDRRFETAVSLRSQGRDAEALEKITGFIAEHPDDARLPKALLLQGSCQLSLGREKEALASWAALAGRSAAAPETPVALARSVALHRRQVLAGEDAESAAAKSAELTARLVMEYPGHPWTSRVLLEGAHSSFARKRYSEYLEALEPIRERLPAGEADFMRYATLAAAGKLDVFTVAAAASRSFESNDRETAIRLYEEALKLFPEGARVREIKTRLGWCYFTREPKEDYERAEKLWQQVAAEGGRDHWSGEARWHLVQLAAGPRRKPLEAAEMCARIAEDFQGTPVQEQAMFRRGQLLYEAQYYRKAQTALEELIEAYPEKAKHPPVANLLEGSRTQAQAGKGKE